MTEKRWNPARPLYDRVRDFIHERSDAYKLTFGNPVGKRVLADLSSVCYATKSVFDKDPYEAARRAGRREVFLHIAQQINLSAEELAALKGILDHE